MKRANGRSFEASMIAMRAHVQRYEVVDMFLHVSRWLALAVGVLFAASVAHAAQRTFASPEEAADALARAAKAHDSAAMLGILGPQAEKAIRSPDKVADRARAEQFAATYEQKHAIVRDGDSRANLTLGNDDFPFAFPLVKTADRWRFDTAAGVDEMNARRIGENELSVINVMLAIVDAQHDYASADRNRDGVREYARKFASAQGRHDGLYWPTKSGEPPSPLGALMTAATAEGYKQKSGPTPYHGYYFRMLTGQGSHAKGGALDYVVKGHMIGGFAAIAYPAKYLQTGVMTFIVNYDGVVYQKDLGPNTAEVARKITRYDPGDGWVAAPGK
jgi:hypothetical protein